MILKKIININFGLRFFLKKFLVLLLIPGFLVFNPFEIQSAQNRGTASLTAKYKSTKKKRKVRRRRIRRSYNPTRTRANAIELIRRTSVLVSDLAGLQPMIDPNYIYDDSEDAEDIEEFEEYDSEVTDTEQQVEVFSETAAADETNVIANEKVDIDSFKTLWLSYVDDGKIDEYTQGGIHKKTLMKIIMNWFGTPYRFGGTTNRAIDCSAFIQRMFTDVCDLTLPRTARVQINAGTVISKEELEFGDLVFFHTYSLRFASHVGIYLGDGLFAHASSKYGVTVSSLKSGFYSSHLMGARRIYLDDMEHFVHKSNISSKE